MLKRFKNVFVMYSNQLWQMLIVIGVFWVLGMVLVGAIFMFQKDRPETFVNIGFLCATTLGVLSVVMVSIVFYAIHFNIAVSMGVSRKQFLLESSLVLFVQNLIYIAFVFVLGNIELLMAKGIYKGVPLDEKLIKLDLNLLGLLLAGSIATIAISIFIGALLQRFGKTAFWILWGIYMCFALGGTGMINLAKNANNGIIGEIFAIGTGFFANITTTGMLTIFVALCTILAATGIMIFRKSPVK